MTTAVILARRQKRRRRSRRTADIPTYPRVEESVVTSTLIKLKPKSSNGGGANASSIHAAAANLEERAAVVHASLLPNFKRQPSRCSSHQNTQFINILRGV